ncbi:hypothetical protein V8C34DRAFT_267167 [Trichoderma compactum]
MFWTPPQKILVVLSARRTLGIPVWPAAGHEIKKRSAQNVFGQLSVHYEIVQHAVGAIPLHRGGSHWLRGIGRFPGRLKP